MITFLFTLLHLSDHMRLGLTCKLLRKAAGILPPALCRLSIERRQYPPPYFAIPARDNRWIRPAAWRKPVTPPSSVQDGELHKLIRFAGITSLHLAFRGNITDWGLVVFMGLPNLPLQHLDLKRCQRITDGGLAHLQSLQQLRHLSLDRCMAITDDGLLHLKHLPLQHLNLTFCQRITDDGLAHLRSLQQLRHLSLARCHAINGTGLASLLTLPLQHLDLQLCHKITRAGMVQLEQLPHLEYLHVTRWPCAGVYIGKESILSFLQNCKNIQYVE